MRLKPTGQVGGRNEAPAFQLRLHWGWVSAMLIPRGKSISILSALLAKEFQMQGGGLTGGRAAELLRESPLGSGSSEFESQLSLPACVALAN